LEDKIVVCSQFVWKTKLLSVHNLFGRQNCCLFTIYLEDRIVVDPTKIMSSKKIVIKQKFCLPNKLSSNNNFVFHAKTELLSVHNLFGRQNCCLFTIYLEDKIVVCSQFIWKTKLLFVHNLFERQNYCLITIYLEDNIFVLPQTNFGRQNCCLRFCLPNKL
jgi:hypothetical protein